MVSACLMLMASFKESEYEIWRSQLVIMFSKKKRITNLLTGHHILLVWASKGSIGGQEEGNWMIVQVVMDGLSQPSQRPPLQGLESVSHDS